MSVLRRPVESTTQKQSFLECLETDDFRAKAYIFYPPSMAKITYTRTISNRLRYTLGVTPTLSLNNRLNELPSS